MRARIRNISFLTLDSFTFRQLFSTRRTNVEVQWKFTVGTRIMTKTKIHPLGLFQMSLTSHDYAFSCIALSALTLTSTCMCILLKLLFINDIPLNVNTAPVGDVALFAADADSALCDCSGDLC